MNIKHFVYAFDLCTLLSSNSKLLLLYIAYIFVNIQHIAHLFLLPCIFMFQWQLNKPYLHNYLSGIYDTIWFEKPGELEQRAQSHNIK